MNSLQSRGCIVVQQYRAICSLAHRRDEMPAAAIQAAQLALSFGGLRGVRLQRPRLGCFLSRASDPAPEDARVQPGNCFPGWQRHTARACGQQAFGILPPASQASLLSRLGRTAASRSAPRTPKLSHLLHRVSCSAAFACRFRSPHESVHAMGCLVTIEQHVPTPALWLPAPSRSSELSPG